MDIEFHYYMTHLIALRAGFKPSDAYTIAYASQYTDDNVTEYKVEGGDEPFANLISQTEDITKPQEERLSIYPIFHFCPGTKSEVFKLSPPRRDGKFHLLATIPDNKNARTIFDRALKSGDLCRIGIGTHMYADTFCHRDFAGWKDEFNWSYLGGFIGSIWSALGPAIGHALVMHAPDIPPMVWDDMRLTSPYKEKKNKEQILTAAGNIFDYYCRNTKPGNAESIKKQLLGDLDAAIGAETEWDSGDLTQSRMANYRALLGGDYLGGDYKEYDKSQWFDAAVDRQVDAGSLGSGKPKFNFFWKSDYRNSDWFKFQEAVKVHQTVALNVFSKTFREMEVEVA